MNADNEEDTNDELAGSCAVECAVGDWFAEINCKDSAVMNHEPVDVCYLCYVLLMTEETICAERDEVFGSILM